MSEHEMAIYLQQLLRCEKAGERATLEVGPYTAMLLIGVIYWALRSGTSQFAEHGPVMFQRVTDQLRLLFVDDPVGEELIRQHQQGDGR